MSLLAFMDGSRGNSLRVRDNVSTSMVANAVFNSQTECFSSIVGSQVISITTDPNPPDLTSACNFCKDQMADIYQKRLAITPEDQKSKIPPALVTAFQQGVFPVLETDGSDGTDYGIGPCELVCKSVVQTNISQKISATAKETCTVSNTVRNDVQQQLSEEIKSYLSDQQDIFGKLGSLFVSNQDTMAVNLASSLSTSTNTSLVNTIHSRIKNIQEYVLTASSSVFTDGVQQSAKATQVGNLNAVSNTLDQIRQSASYSITQALIYENDTIGDLAKDLGGIVDALAAFSENLVASTLVAVCLVIAVIVIFMGLRVYRDPQKKEALKNWCGV